jgi:hypothetical protein
MTSTASKTPTPTPKKRIADDMSKNRSIKQTPKKKQGSMIEEKPVQEKSQLNLDIKAGKSSVKPERKCITVNSKMQGSKKKRVAKKSQTGVKARIRKRCSTEGCTNKAKTGGVCVTHGAKVTQKKCCFEGCTNQAVKGGVCKTHGAKVERKLCSHEGCANQAQRVEFVYRMERRLRKRNASLRGVTIIS